MRIKQPVSAQTTIEIVPPDGFSIRGDTHINPEIKTEKEDLQMLYNELCDLVSRVNDILSRIRPYIYRT